MKIKCIKDAKTGTVRYYNSDEFYNCHKKKNVDVVEYNNVGILNCRWLLAFSYLFLSCYDSLKEFINVSLLCK